MSEEKEGETPFDLGGIERVRDTLADTLHVTARTIAGEVDARRPDDPEAITGAVDWGLQTSRWLDHLSDELRQWDVRRSEARVRASIVAHPGRVLLVAAVVGMVVSRALRRR